MPTLPTSAVLLVDASALQANLTSFGWSAHADLQDATDLGDTARSWVPGVVSGELSVEGFFDGTVSGLDQMLSGLLGTSGASVVSLAPQGDGAVGNRCYLASARLAEYTVSSQVGELVGVATTWHSDGRIGHGIVLADRVARTATANGTTQDNGVATQTGAIANLHVTAASGTSPTLNAKVQHSADGVTWVDLVTFAQSTGAGAQSKTVTGTVNRYVRATWTIGGTSPSFTFAITFAR